MKGQETEETADKRCKYSLNFFLVAYISTFNFGVVSGKGECLKKTDKSKHA